MNHTDNPSSIKYYVKKFLFSNKERLKGKKIIDFPAGNGVTSKLIMEIGATAYPFDLFPEYFEIDTLKCEKVEISEGIPLEDNFSDLIICQEGIEHFPDQLSVLKEFNRVIVDKGILLITTPNYSNLRAKLSYLLSESERFNSHLAPNELDSIWMSKQNEETETYYGHIFLIGLQKLRTLATLAGFRIKKIHATKYKSTSMILFPLFYPFILLSNWLAFRKRMKNNTITSDEKKHQVYGEIFRLSISPKVLLSGHLMVEFEKVTTPKELARYLDPRDKEFGKT